MYQPQGSRYTAMPYRRSAAQERHRSVVRVLLGAVVRQVRVRREHNARLMGRGRTLATTANRPGTRGTRRKQEQTR